MYQRPSQRPYNVRYYRLNREAEIRRVRRRQDEKTAYLREVRSRPCLDCKGAFAPYQMDFDHRDPRAKSFGIMTGRAQLMSRVRLDAEIAKCDIVCANCHRIREWNRRRFEPEKVYRSPRPGRDPPAKLAAWRAHSRLLNNLRAVPCLDCGRRFPSFVMDFDHRDPSSKTRAVSRTVGRAQVHEILAEATKCDIVCANCHRLRTWVRRTVACNERE